MVRPLHGGSDVIVPIAAYDKSEGLPGLKRDPSVQVLPGWCSAAGTGAAQPRVVLASHVCLGLFDGHGGSHVASLLASTLHGEMDRDGIFRAPVAELPTLLSATFLRVDKEICKNRVRKCSFTIKTKLNKTKKSG